MRKQNLFPKNWICNQQTPIYIWNKWHWIWKSISQSTSVAKPTASWHIEDIYFYGFLHSKPMVCCVCQLAHTTAHWHVGYVNWHTQHPIGMLCMPIGIHNSSLAWLLCMSISIHNNPSIGLVCMPIGIHYRPLAWLLCIPIGIHSMPIGYCVC